MLFIDSNERKKNVTFFFYGFFFADFNVPHEHARTRVMFYFTLNAARDASFFVDILRCALLFLSLYLDHKNPSDAKEKLFLVSFPD